MYSGKLSIPGKLSNELSYVFIDDEIEQQNSSVTLFGMFDIKSGSELYHIIIKEAVKHFLDFYHRAHTASGAGFDELGDSGEFIFESSIQYTYEKVSDALRDAQEKTVRAAQIELRKVHCILGALIDDTLFLSITGTALSPFLMYPTIDKQGSSRYSMLNIIKQSGDSAPDTTSRLFATIISGKISVPSSTIIICNQTLLDYIDPQHIKQIVSNTPIASVMKNFHAILSKVNSRADFSALLFSNAPSGLDQQYSKTRSTISSTSMQGLNGTEERTHSILTPAVQPYLKKYSNQFLRSIVVLLQRAVSVAIGSLRSFFSPERMTAATRACKKILGRILTEIRHFPDSAHRVWNSLRSIITILRSADWTHISSRCSHWYNEKKHMILGLFTVYRQRFLGLSRQSRSLLILSALFIVLFIASLVSMQFRNGAALAGTRTREIIAGIEQKNDQIDASLLYDDRDRARSLLEESKALLALVDKKYYARTDYKAVAEKIKKSDAQINNIIRIDTLDVVTALVSEQQGALTGLHSIGSGSTLLVYSSDTLYLFDELKKELKQLSNIQGKIKNISCAVAASNTLFYFCSADNSHLITLTLPDQTVATVSLPRHAGETSLDSVQIYNNRLYVLTKNSGALYRHLSVATGFSRGTPWTRQPQEPLKETRTFAVDGKVYALGTDGNIRLYATGTIQERPTSEATKNVLIHATSLWTDNEDPFLFALVPSEKKIVAINKQTFDLSAQIVSDQFTDLQGFSVNRTKKEILILDAGRIIRVPFDIK